LVYGNGVNVRSGPRLHGTRNVKSGTGTVTDRRYPLLFQQGETAFGKPIVDGQHPHDLFMEIAALYDLKFGGKPGAGFRFYFAPIGDPARGARWRIRIAPPRRRIR